MEARQEKEMMRRFMDGLYKSEAELSKHKKAFIEAEGLVKFYTGEVQKFKTAIEALNKKDGSSNNFIQEAKVLYPEMPTIKYAQEIRQIFDKHPKGEFTSGQLAEKLAKKFNITYSEYKRILRQKISPWLIYMDGKGMLKKDENNQYSRTALWDEKKIKSRS